MILKFELSMPSVNSWNGKWSGEGKLYCIVKSFNSRKDVEKAREILETGYYYYCFGDGWSAGVSVEEIDGKQARKYRSKSSGFCGYDWMVKSIFEHGKIVPSVT